MNHNWTYKKLGEVATITMGQSPTSDTYNESEGLPFFQGNADFGKLHPNVRIYCNAPIRIADNDDVLISVRAPIGAINIADRKCCIGRGLAAIRGNEKRQSRFIYYLLLASKDKLVAQGTGSTFKSIGKDALYNLSVPSVSLETQSRIVSELDLLQSIIDKQKAQLKELDTLAQSIFYDMFGDPVDNDKGWEVKMLGEICSLKAGKAIKASELSDNIAPSLFPCYGGNGVRGYINKYSHTESYPIVGRQGALCGNVNFAEAPFYATEHALVIKPIKNINTKWLFFQLKSMRLNQYAHGVAQPGLAVQDIEPLNCVSPPLSLQQSFAAKIKAIEKQKALVNQSITETQRLFDYTMDKYFG